jgi:hypothetical protein
MSTMFIRVKKDGFIYDYNPILAKNPDCEVVPEEIAYPERFVPPHVAERVAAAMPEQKPKAARKPKAALDLTTADIPEAPAYTSAELAADASRGLPA